MIAIVIDSTACMTKKEARELGIVCIPMNYTVDGVSYTENFVDSNDGYETLISSTENLTTSQASVDAYYKLFEGLLASNFEVLCLTISSRLSGTFSNASVCARELDRKRIRIVDTETTAGGMFIMVKEARKLVDAGLSLEETAKSLEGMRHQVRTIFSVSDMGPLRRSGRLGPVRLSVGTILNIRPILTLKKGAVEAVAMARGRNEQLHRLLDAVPAHAEEIIVHAIRSMEDAEILKSRLEAKCQKEVQIRGVGPVLSIHLGLDVISAMWLDRKL